MKQPNPFHIGEIELQNTLGVAERMARLGPRAIRDYMPAQHRAFFEQLPFLVVGATDPDDAVWASLIAGPEGFVQVPHPQWLRVKALPSKDDPAFAGLREGASVGLLGIELHTRRRNRLNGIIGRHDETGFDVGVQQSFGNCPRFIFPRLTTYSEGHCAASNGVVSCSELTDAMRRLIMQADTFFVASCADIDGQRQTDVSHRGGAPGFVRLDPQGRLNIPDYPGNRYFNTLGNLQLNPRAGLLFPDFATGDLLQLTGKTEVILTGDEVAQFEGAERMWRFTPQRCVYRPDAIALRWSS